MGLPTATKPDEAYADISLKIYEGDRESLPRLRKALVLLDQSEADFMHEAISRFLVLNGHLTDEATMLTKKELEAAVLDDFGIVILKEQLYQWRSTPWIEDVDYFRKGPKTYIYDYERLKPFFDRLLKVRNREIPRKYVRKNRPAAVEPEPIPKRQYRRKPQAGLQPIKHYS